MCKDSKFQVLGWRTLGLGHRVSGLKTILNIHGKPGGDVKIVGWRRGGIPNPITYPGSPSLLGQVSHLWCPPPPLGEGMRFTNSGRPET